MKEVTAEMEEDNLDGEGGLMQRLRESPRTVSALIIILIVAAAIYAFSGDENSQVSGDLGGEPGATETSQEGEVAVTADDADKEGQVAAETTADADEEVMEEEEEVVLPEPERTSSSYVEVAEAGNGATHLARKAATRWLSENQASYEVTAEHRIYIEDYIQKKMGSPRLSLGETQEIGFDLISEAVAKAGELNKSQLQNLSQYTAALG